MSFNTGDTALINTFQKTQFVQGIENAYQQSTSIVRPHFETHMIDGALAYFDRVGVADDMVQETVRYGTNPVSEIPHDRRQFQFTPYHQGKPIETLDLMKVVEDPTNAYSQALVSTLHRKEDDIVISNIFGNAYTGLNGATTMAFVGTTSGGVTVGAYSAGTTNPITTAGIYTLTAGNYEGIDVAVDYSQSGTVSGGTGLTLDKLKAVRKTMERLNGLEDGEELDCFITSAQADQLLNIEEIINSDYSAAQALKEGRVANFLNFRFIRCELLGKAIYGAGTSSSPRTVIVSKPRSGKYCQKSVRVDMWQLPQQRNIPYLYIELVAGFSRAWGEITAKINCLD